MALRTFLDSQGQEWQAFDVIPRSTERRAGERRSGAMEQQETDEERRESDRRLTVGPARVASRDAGGWLTFERGDDRRRLSPIPDDWQRCSEAELDAYLRAARAVAKKKSAAG